MANASDEPAAGPSAPVEAWPQRLRTSAARLCAAAQALNDALADPRRFERLTSASDASSQAAADVSEFHRQLRTALGALVDLTAHDNPEQAVPDLATWFEFRCPNVVYGQHTDRVLHSP